MPGSKFKSTWMGSRKRSGDLELPEDGGHLHREVATKPSSAAFVSAGTTWLIAGDNSPSHQQSLRVTRVAKPRPGAADSACGELAAFCHDEFHLPSPAAGQAGVATPHRDRKSKRLNSSHLGTSN